MNKEENVYGKTTKAEEVAVAKEGVGERREENVSAVLGKFKDVDALANAYSSLQAEFTRRSQRLRELERAAENFSFVTGAEGSGTERLRKNAAARRAESKRFDEFLTGLGEARSALDAETAEKEGVGDGVATVAEEEPVGEKKAPEEAKTDVSTEPKVTEGKAETQPKELASTEATEASREETPETEVKERKTFSSVAEENAKLSSEQLYEQVSRDEKTRLRIIGEYLASIGRSGAPLTSGNTGALSAPPLKARSIGDAGNMALQYFKSSGEA